MQGLPEWIDLFRTMIFSFYEISWGLYDLKWRLSHKNTSEQRKPDIYLKAILIMEREMLSWIYCENMGSALVHFLDIFVQSTKRDIFLYIFYEA